MNKKKAKITLKKPLSCVLNKDGSVVFSLDTKLYPTEVIYQTAYVFTRDAYVILDGDPEKIIKVNLRWKDLDQKFKPIEIRGKFTNELLNQTVRGMVNLQNAKLKEQIVSRALVSASGNTEFDDILKDLEDVNDSELDSELTTVAKKLKK